MAQTEPWISFHAPWTSRAKSGLVVLDQIERFLAAVAVDPAPDFAELVVREAVVPGGGPLARDALARFGPTRRSTTASPPDPIVEHRWERRDRPVDAAAFADFYRAYPGLPAVRGLPAVEATVSYWFEVKRPGTAAPLFPGAHLRSSVMVWLAQRAVNLSIRYDAPDFTPELRAIHAEIVAALGPKTPRHALQRIIPARTPTGRERRERLA